MNPATTIKVLTIVTSIGFILGLVRGSGDRHLHVIDLDLCERIAKIDFGARIYASPVLIGDRVVFGTCGGKLIEIDVATLEVKGALQLPDAITNAVTAGADGRRLFVSTYMNCLCAFERLEERSAPIAPSSN